MQNFRTTWQGTRTFNFVRVRFFLPNAAVWSFFHAVPYLSVGNLCMSTKEAASIKVPSTLFSITSSVETVNSFLSSNNSISDAFAKELNILFFRVPEDIPVLYEFIIMTITMAGNMSVALKIRARLTWKLFAHRFLFSFIRIQISLAVLLKPATYPQDVYNKSYIPRRN